MVPPAQADLVEETTHLARTDVTCEALASKLSTASGLLLGGDFGEVPANCHRIRINSSWQPETPSETVAHRHSTTRRPPRRSPPLHDMGEQMIHSRRRVSTVAAAVTGLALVASGCGAGSKTSAETATEVECDYEAPSGKTEVNVLAYNSSSVDPYTNTMVSSCSKGDVTVNHEPIDFGGQVQKTTATLAGDTGTYDIIETYSFVIPQLASEGKLEPLDDLVSKYGDEYGLDEINENMSGAMSYDGKLYGLPMQAQMLSWPTARTSSTTSASPLRRPSRR